MSMRVCVCAGGGGGGGCKHESVCMRESVCEHV